MHPAHLRNDSGESPEHMFAAKYAWLLRWALQFTENDRAAAEDLVQETFVRILLAWDKLHSLHDLEPLLYSYLRYAHLSERRKRQSYAFQSLSTVDADTLAVSLRASASFDQVEVQSELRSILAYLLWRRRSAKFASIFLLRFFHGFYPEEIASISVATRHSVDLSLRQARAELKAHLLDSTKLELPARSKLPELQRLDEAIPLEEFADELRREIFETPREMCPSHQELDRYYRSFTTRSLDCDLMAHIVVCRACLAMVSTLSGSPPSSARSTDDSLSYAPRDKQRMRTAISITPLSSANHSVASSESPTHHFD
jgi:RNA polymerase sigma factor (sigma-70 family)